MTKQFSSEGAAVVQMSLGGVRQVHGQRNEQVGARRQGRRHQGRVAHATDNKRLAARRNGTPARQRGNVDEGQGFATIRIFGPASC